MTPLRSIWFNLKVLQERYEGGITWDKAVRKQNGPSSTNEKGGGDDVANR